MNERQPWSKLTLPWEEPAWWRFLARRQRARRLCNIDLLEARLGVSRGDKIGTYPGSLTLKKVYR